jgi:hypothetical protein
MKFFTTRISIVRKAPRLRYLGGIERAFEPALGSFGWVYLTAPGRLATIEARPLPGDGGVRGVPWVFGLPMADWWLPTQSATPILLSSQGANLSPPSPTCAPLPEPQFTAIQVSS